MYNWKGWRRSSSTGKQHRREAEGGLLCSWKKVEGRSINEKDICLAKRHIIPFQKEAICPWSFSAL